MSEVSDFDYDDDYNYDVYDREDPWVDPRDNQSTEDNIYDRVIEKFTLEFNAMKKLLEDERALRTAQVSELQVQLTQVKVENKKLLQSIDILESKRRKNNVIIFGIDEHENAESPVTTVENICEQLDVAINPGTITDAYRVGRNKGKRPIVCTVSSFNKKTEMMQKNKAKGQFAILHDLTKKERREKKELKEKLDDVRSRGYHAYIRHGNLIVEGQTFTRDDLLGNAAVSLTAEKKGDTQRENAAALDPPTNPDIAPVQMAAVSPELPDTRKLCAPLTVTSRKKPVTPATPERTPSVKRAAPASQRTVPARRNLPSQQPASAVGVPPPELVWAAQGQDAELPCDVTPPVIGDRVNMVLWFKDNAGIPLYSLDARGGALEHGAHWAMGSALGARTFFLVGSGGTAGRLRVNNVEASDQGVYRCRVDFLNSRTRNFRVNLTIVVPPDLPMIYDAQGDEVSGEAGPFLEGYDLFLSCHVSGGRPQAAVSWWMGAQLLDAIHDGSSGNVSVNQLFISSVGRALWGQRLACHGRNSNLTAPVVREVALLIYLKPRKVHIGVGRGETLSAGRIQTLRCEAWGSVPAPRITWLLDGEPLRLADTVVTHGSNSSWSALTMQPTPHDHGRELTCRAENPRFPGGFVEDRLRLNIAYAPVATVKLGVNIDPATIKEGDNVYLSCEVTANPMPAYVSWMHNEKPLDQDPEAGVLTGERRLLLKAVTRLAAGTYQCVASNSEGEARSEPLLLRVQFSPRCRGDEGSRQVGALRHETLAVRCEVEADPPSVRFSWTYNRSRDVLHVPGSRVHSAGLTSTLDYTPVSDVDFGTLACWASNAVGRQKQPCLFHVVPARAPRPPEQCAVSNSTGGAGLEVTCVAGDDGGLPQYFVLEVTETRPEHALGGRRRNRGEDDDSGEEQEVAVGAAVQADGPIGESPPLLRVLSAEPRFALDSLDPTRRYDLTVHAANARGRSDPVLLARVRVLASEEHRLASTGNTSTSNEVAQPAALVLGALVAVASLALCCLFAAVAAVLCRHRRAAPRSRPQPPADKPLELSVIAPPPPAPAPATVRPHRHLGPHRRSAGQQDNDPSSQTALLTEQVNDPSWRRSSGEPQQQQQQQRSEPDLIVSKAEVVLHLQSAAMAAKAPRTAVLTSPSGQEVGLGSRA